MNREQFKSILENYCKILDNISKLSEIGVNLYDSTYEISTSIDKMFTELFEIHYSEFGTDWIYWFAWENNFGASGLEAFDGDKLICQTVDQLFDYIEQYKL